MARAFPILLASALLSAITHAAPPRFARLGNFEGQVDVELDPADSWRPAISNLPLPESARIHTGANAKVEIEFDDASVLRMVGEGMAELSDYTRLSGGQRILVISLDHGLAYFTGEPGPADAIHLLVPGAQVMLKQGSRIRLEASDNSSEIAIVEGAARFTIPTAEMDLRQGQSARVAVPDSSHFSLFREIAPLQPDTWNEELDKAEVDSPGSTLDLDRNGKWIADGDYGTIWQPPAQAGWAPFRQGRWVWYQSIGFTWVAAEMWGWRPYHEGRWLQHRTLGWVWVPGAVEGTFSPGDVFWARTNGQALWGPLAPSEQWTGIGPPRQFALLNVTGGAFVLGVREILPSPAEDLPKDLLKAFLFAPALPSPSLPTARLNVTRDALRTRMYSAIGVTPDVPVTRASPPPPEEPPVVAELLAPPAAPVPTTVRDPDPVVSDGPVVPVVPGIIAITVPNKAGNKTNSKVAVPAKTTTYVAAIPPNVVTLNGIGPPAPAPLYEHWFEKFTAARLTYQPLGSGRGLSDLKDGKIDFAASDSTVTDTQFLQFPAAVTGVVAVYNLPGIADRLRLTPDVLALIFLGEIRYWNDNRIVDLNPRAGMPAAPINVVVAFSSNASTYTWTDYLSKMSSVWKAKMGDATATLSWRPFDALGAKGEQGIADIVQHTPYSLGYVDYSVALKSKIAMAAVKNKAGAFVFAQHDTLTEAATMLEPSIADSDGSHAYPIASFTYLLLPKRSFDQTKRGAMIAFLKWMLTDGQKEVADFGFAPLPAKVVEREQQRVSHMRGQ